MIEIIPAIDIIGGKCVRLTEGDYNQKTVYSDSPLEIAKQFEAYGFKRLHLVDLDGTKQGKIANLNVLKEIYSNTKLAIDFGGGIKTENDFEMVFEAGASFIGIGSLAVKAPILFELMLHKYGFDKIILNSDVKNEQIAINGWQENTSISIFDFLNTQIENGVKNILCTDISKDGLLKGPSIELYKSLLDKFHSINLIASGGVTNISDIEELEKIGCKSVIIGKAIYEGRISLTELQKFQSC